MNQSYKVPAPGEPFDPSVYRLGLPCKRDHLWADNVTIRVIKSKKCPLCERIDALDRQRKRKAKDPIGENAKAAAWIAEHRRQNGRPYRGKHSIEWHELRSLQHAIKQCGKYPSVARLVHSQQREHWREHPEERKAHYSKWNAYLYKFKYTCDPAFRLHQCSRTSERRVKHNGNHTVYIDSNQLTMRFAQFNNNCAYCGSNDNLQVEHFIPRSKGGPHALGNILPACQKCNSSKYNHEPEQWYQSQSFFSKARWRKILVILGKAKLPVLQLPFL